MPLALKINYPGGTVVLRGLADDSTLGQLKDKVSESVPDFPPAEQKFKCGFPPSDVEGSDAVLLSELGIKSGTALSLSRKAPGDIVSDATLPPPPAKDSSAPATLPTPPSSDTVSSESGQGESLKRRLMEMGFSERVAKKALEMSDQNLEAAFEMCLGGVITEESLGPESSSGGRSSEAAHTGRSQRMVRRVIDADNSCLFNAIGYLMERDLKSGSRLRRLIADTVLSNPYTYNEAMLGKPPREYATWILKPETWGGEIELFILSQHFRVEIVAIEIRSLHCYSYGEEHSYPRRIFVLYDGVHYDALAESSSPDAAASSDVTQFPSSDGSKKEAALALAAEAKARRQYVDLVGCTLRCMVCDKAFKGQKEAIQHASVTKHQNFGEV